MDRVDRDALLDHPPHVMVQRRRDEEAGLAEAQAGGILATDRIVRGVPPEQDGGVPPEQMVIVLFDKARVTGAEKTRVLTPVVPVPFVTSASLL